MNTSTLAYFIYRPNCSLYNNSNTVKYVAFFPPTVLSFIKHHSMKYGGMEVQLHAFLISATQPPANGPSIGLVAGEGGEQDPALTLCILCPCRELNTDSSVV
jgi:hypothetical protein